MLLAVVALALQVAAGATAFVVITLSSGDSTEAARRLIFNPWTLLPILAFSVGTVLALGLRATREPARQFFQMHPFAPGLVPAVIVTSTGVAIFMHEIDNWILHTLSVVAGADKLSPDFLDMAAAPVGAFLVAVLAAPLLEEYFFRGLILRGLLVHGRPLRAVLFSALLFGIAHGNLRQFVIGFVLGSASGWWYERTRSVGPGMIGHAVVNGVTWVAALLPKPAARLGLVRPPGMVVHEPGWLFLIGLVLIAVGVWRFHRRAIDIEPGTSWPQAYRSLDEPPVLEQPVPPELPPLLEPTAD
ncbi:MAG: amino terminal protease self-immunity [Verrucomicrobia bacterium]|nr:amino terminal protease self-immunity [Verrucomicrobiota bacterium]